jgi:hypothetical protein
MKIFQPEKLTHNNGLFPFSIHRMALESTFFWREKLKKVCPPFQLTRKLPENLQSA